MNYLHVRNWDKYQHYKNRQPIWIKLHVELLDDLEMRGKVSTITRLAWPHVLLLAARHGNTLKDDEIWLGSCLDLDRKTARLVLTELRKGRWLTGKRASSLIAKRYPSRASARSQEKRRIENPLGEKRREEIDVPGVTLEEPGTQKDNGQGNLEPHKLLPKPPDLKPEEVRI